MRVRACDACVFSCLSLVGNRACCLAVNQLKDMLAPASFFTIRSVEHSSDDGQPHAARSSMTISLTYHVGSRGVNERTLGEDQIRELQRNMIFNSSRASTLTAGAAAGAPVEAAANGAGAGAGAGAATGAGANAGAGAAPAAATDVAALSPEQLIDQFLDRVDMVSRVRALLVELQASGHPGYRDRARGKGGHLTSQTGIQVSVRASTAQRRNSRPEPPPSPAVTACGLRVCAFCSCR